jgi:hypothetical protein
VNQKTGILIGLAALAALVLFRRKPIASVSTFEFYDTDEYIPGSTSYPESIKTFARAIAHAEGFGVPDAIPTIANNPGDLALPGWTPTIGAGIAIFDDVNEGWSRLYRQLGLILSGSSQVYNLDMSLAEMGMKYSGGDPNWAVNVAAYLGVSTDAPLWQVIV